MGCESWCIGNSKPWTKKCGWKKCNGCTQCDVPSSDLPTSSPIPIPSNPPVSSPISSPTKAPVSTVDFCCTWDFFHCGLDTFCNENSINCQGSCGGVWMEKSS